jgi:hypothetical protein
MRAQAEQVTFAYPGLFESEANVALADLVCTLAGPGLDRAFFVSGGSERRRRPPSSSPASTRSRSASPLGSP